MMLMLMLACGGSEDLDKDGVLAAVDCDDNDAAIGKASLAYLDQDGDGYGRDEIWAKACPADSGWVSEGGDCDDEDPTEHPGAQPCDCVRGDQDSAPWYVDQDGDGSGAGPAAAQQCGFSEGLAPVDGDCDDSDPARHPGAEEIWYDGVDQDCGQDNDYDADGDGYDAADHGGQDCDDSAPGTNPGAVEVCDSAQTDEDCDGLVNAADPGAVGWSWRYPDQDQDGYGAGEAQLVCAPVFGFSERSDDCQDELDTVHPDAPEICGDGVVNDCEQQSYECGVFGGYSIGSEQMLQDETSWQLGASLLGPVDIDGDGSLEFLAGAPSTIDPESGATVGAVYWISAQASSGELLLLGEGTFGNAGGSLASGDSNGDGQTDLLIGARNVYSADASYQGQAYLVTGPITAGLELKDQVTLRGRAYDSYFGTQVAVMEGEALVVSSPYAQNSAGQYAGEVYLFDLEPGLEASHLDALSLISVEEASGSFGLVLTACDFEGTGLQGLMVSGPRLSAGEGQVFWIPDPAAGDLMLTSEDALLDGSGAVGSAITCADFDGDGQLDLAASAPEQGEVAVVLQSQGSVSWPQAWARLESGPSYSMLAPGDLDQDGSEELWLGDLYRSEARLLYGPWEAGVRGLGEDKVSASGGYFGAAMAGDSQGVVISGPSLSTGSLVFLPGGQGI